MQAERTWSEAFIWHIRQAPFQLAHMRELAETTVSAQAAGAGKITGTKDRATLPYRVDPADDADRLWVNLVLFAQEVSERTGNPAPRAVRAQMWHGRHEPQGLPLCTPSEAFSMAAEIVRWLEACTHQIAHDGALTQAPDNLIDLIRELRRHYPRAEPKFKAYRPRPCPTCGERTILPIWGPDGLAGAKCDNCGQTWEKQPE